MAGVEAVVGRRFGDPSDPLLVSVRSGAPVSMPGMMDTILDLGLNDATERGPGRASPATPAFARSCRERFEASFRSIVGVADVPDDPWQQLRLAIEAVFRSWNSDRAQRLPARKEGIADDLGTAVTVQAMVFGNRGRDVGDRRRCSRATRRPASRRSTATSCSTPRARTSSPGPMRPSRSASSTSGCRPSPPSCASYATRLERHYADLCDIEFTIEHGRLWMLQVRVGKRSPQAALRIAVDMAEDADVPAVARGGGRAGRAAACAIRRRRSTAATGGDARRWRPGLPASPGMASGEIVDHPRGRRGRRRGGSRRDPRPGRDLARRRPRDGPGGRDPDLARRPRQPRRGRRPRLGDPGGGRRGRRSRSGTARSSSASASCTPATSSRSTAAPARCSRARSPARPRSCPRRRRCSPGPRSSGSRSGRRGRCRRRPEGRGSRESAATDRPRHAGRLSPGDRDQGLRPAAAASPTSSSRRPTIVQPILDGLVADGLVGAGGGRAIG